MNVNTRLVVFKAHFLVQALFIYSRKSLYINFGCMNSLDQSQIADYKNEPKTTDLKLTRLAFSSSILVNIAILLSFNLCI